MTKDEFWRILEECADLCDCCPVQIEGKTKGCVGRCAESLRSLYERLERDSDDGAKAREDFMEVVYRELSDDVDNNRANRIIDAADECMEEIARLLREEWEREENGQNNDR